MKSISLRRACYESTGLGLLLLAVVYGSWLSRPATDPSAQQEASVLELVGFLSWCIGNGALLVGIVTGIRCIRSGIGRRRLLGSLVLVDILVLALPFIVAEQVFGLSRILWQD